jgi:hypothetical protein
MSEAREWLDRVRETPLAYMRPQDSERLFRIAASALDEADRLRRMVDRTCPDWPVAHAHVDKRAKALEGL